MLRGKLCAYFGIISLISLNGKKMLFNFRRNHQSWHFNLNTILIVSMAFQGCSLMLSRLPPTLVKMSSYYCAKEQRANSIFTLKDLLNRFQSNKCKQEENAFLYIIRTFWESLAKIILMLIFPLYLLCNISFSFT